MLLIFLSKLDIILWLVLSLNESYFDVYFSSEKSSHSPIFLTTLLHNLASQSGFTIWLWYHRVWSSEDWQNRFHDAREGRPITYLKILKLWSREKVLTQRDSSQIDEWSDKKNRKHIFDILERRRYIFMIDNSAVHLVTFVTFNSSRSEKVKEGVSRTIDIKHKRSWDFSKLYFGWCCPDCLYLTIMTFKKWNL